MLSKTNRTGEKRVAPLMLATPATQGIFAGTKIATRTDWTPIEQLNVGDFVLTAEHGEQLITAMDVSVLDVSSNKPMANQWPIHVPEGVLGNSKPLILAPGMHLVLEDEAAGLLFGHSCVSLKAEDLIGYRGIARARISQPMTHFTLEFSHGVSLVVEGGVFFDMPSPHGARRFEALDARQARLLVRHMGEEDHTHRSRKVASGWI
jgi:hypothetical protein